MELQRRVREKIEIPQLDFAKHSSSPAVVRSFTLQMAVVADTYSQAIP